MIDVTRKESDGTMGIRYVALSIVLGIFFSASVFAEEVKNKPSAVNKSSKK